MLRSASRRIMGLDMTYIPKKLFQVIKGNFMTALLNFIGKSASKPGLTAGHSKWHSYEENGWSSFQPGLGCGRQRDYVSLLCSLHYVCKVLHSNKTSLEHFHAVVQFWFLTR